MSRDDAQPALLSASMHDIDAVTLLPATGIATIFLDRQARIRGFTPAATDVFALNSDNIGARLDEVSHFAVDMPQLPDIEFLLMRDKPIEHELQTVDGRWFQRTVLPRRSSRGARAGVVITFVEITERKCTEMRLTVQNVVTRILVDAESINEAARDILPAIYDGFEGATCTLWTLNKQRDRLRCFRMLPREDVHGLQEFQRLTRSYQFARGVGLPGQTWEAREPVWFEDISEGEFMRSTCAADCQLVSGVAFPILAGKQFCGVIEFFTRQRFPRHQALVDVLAAIGREIGEFINRCEASERLKAEQARKLAILEASLDAIITMDHEGRIVDFNPAAEQTLGFLATEVVGHPLSEVLVPEEFRERYRDGFRKFLEEGTSEAIGKRMELTALRADGREIPVEVAINAVTTEDGSPFFVGFLRDITEVKIAKKRQERRQHIEQFLSKAGPQLTASLDQHEVLSRVTRLCVPTLGDWAILEVFNPDDSTRAVEVTHADPAGSTIAERVRAFPGPETLFGYSLTASASPAESQWVATVTAADLDRIARDENHVDLLRALNPGSFVAVPLISRGVMLGVLTVVLCEPTQKYGREDLHILEELARRAAIALDNAHLYARAERANQAKSDFLANMSHEIRTPMTAVLGYADILAQRVEDPICREKIDIIKRNGEFLLEIINDILDLSKIEAGRIEPELERIELAELVGDALSLMHLRAKEKNLELSFEYQTAVPEMVISDPIRLRQILINLLGNAIKFTEAGEVKLRIRYDEDGRQLYFDVIDTGIGISQERQEALFQPFSQGDTSQSRKYGGTGLGLAISRRLAELLGGTVTVSSVPGEGSTFTLNIDIGSVEVVATLVSRHSITTIRQTDNAGGQLTHCNVLVVDDRRDIRELTRHYVTEANGEVSTATDGVEAITAVNDAASAGQPFDIILMDLQMPNLDGREATALLRSSGFRQPIVAITADAMQGDREKALSVGCDDYLSKPINAAELISLIARYTRELTLDELESRRCATIHSPGNQEATDPPTPVNRIESFESSPAAQQDAPAHRVLIVDDWPDTSRVMAEYLSLAGFETRTAETGEAAIESYTNWQPHAVLMDLGLPDMDGCDACRAMRQFALPHQTLFIAITGREKSEALERTRDAGFDEYLVKPFDPNHVIELIRERSPALAQP